MEKIKLTLPKKLGNAITKDWYLTGAPKWRGVRFKKTHKNNRVEITITVTGNPEAFEVIKDGIFGPRGFIAKRWHISPSFS